MRLLPDLKIFFTSAAMPLFLGAALTDLAYSASYQIQWSNFSSWLIIAGMVFGTLALLTTVTPDRQNPVNTSKRWLPVAVLVLLWVLGFINAFVHARDAWAMMPTGLILSIICAILSTIAVCLAFCGRREGAVA